MEHFGVRYMSATTGAGAALTCGMYRTDLNNRDKGGAITGVVAIHAALAFAFLHVSGTVDIADAQRELQVFDVFDTAPPPPPPPPPPPMERAQQPKPKKEEGGSAPNIKSEATPIVAPKPRIPIPSPVAVSETPAQGTASTQGLAPVRGPGTGSGGTGTGTGGGSGAGPGGGGDGGIAEMPRLLTPVLRGRDFPSEMLDSWPRGAQVFLRFRIDAGGRIIQCFVDRGTGNPAIDSAICRLTQQRFRYRPAISRSGQAVAGWAGYRQTPPR